MSVESFDEPTMPITNHNITHAFEQICVVCLTIYMSCPCLAIPSSTHIQLHAHQRKISHELYNTATVLYDNTVAIRTQCVYRH